MKTSRLIAAILGAATAVSLTGCSGSASTTASGSSESSPSVSPVATSSTRPPADSPPSPKGSVDGIDVTIAAPAAGPLRPGGDPFGFTVTLANTTPTDLTGVELVVYLGHCGCGLPGARMMPAGSMRMLDPATDTWAAAPYVRAGTGMDFLGQTLVPPFVLTAGQTVTYQLEMRLDANPAVTAGDSLIEVAVKAAERAGYPGHAASLPIHVEP